MSVTAIWNDLNLVRMSIISGYNVGPTMRVSLRECPLIVCAEASKMTQSLVEVLLSLVTAFIGK